MCIIRIGASWDDIIIVVPLFIFFYQSTLERLSDWDILNDLPKHRQLVRAGIWTLTSQTPEFLMFGHLP